MAVNIYIYIYIKEDYVNVAKKFLFPFAILCMHTGYVSLMLNDFQVCHAFKVMPTYPNNSDEYKMRFNRVENMHERNNKTLNRFLH